MLDSPPVEIAPPDLSAYREGSDGVPYVVSLRAEAPGPRVVINALMHGNELSGACALCYLLEHGIRPERGLLTLVFANVEAFLRFDRLDPRASRAVDEDMNRLWDRRVLDSARTSAELERARVLRPIYERADFLLDLHSMYQPGPPLLLSGLTEKGRELARAMGHPCYIIADAGHRNGVRLRDYGRFADPEAMETALLLESGQHWARRSVEVAIGACLRFLRALGTIPAAAAARHLPNQASPAQRLIEVTEAITASDGAFRFVRPFAAMEVIGRAGTVIAYDGRRPIRTPYDRCVLVMPTSRLSRGLTAVRLGRFVDGAP